MADDAEDLSNPRAGDVGGGGAASPLRKVAARIDVPLTSVNTSSQLSSAQAGVEMPSGAWPLHSDTVKGRILELLRKEKALEQPISGIHHVTAIASDPQRNLDFYTEVLGLRLVKRTVNFDDPGSYHLYFGDEVGTPGSILTFFAWPMAGRGSPGVGQVEVTSFGIPEPSLSYWEQRLLSAGVPVERSGKRFDEEVLTFADPDGLKLEMVAHSQSASANRAWKDASVPAQHAIRGFYSVTLCEQGYESTVEVLEAMGFRKAGEQGNRFRFEVGKGEAGARLDILCASEASYGNVAVGIVHHVAWRVADDNAQKSWRTRLVNKHLNVTPVIDRCYFHSIYFRETGGVLFELATDPPGFAIDEPTEKLGEALKLPPWLEPNRKRIEQVLPPIELHKPAKRVEA